ncbi:hypothetical protein HHI36_006635, partial [Cryptolaemus montrouzieri]
NKTVICGDFNVRFSVPDRDSGSYCDLLDSYEFRRTIFVPTREPNCLDNIFLNLKNCMECTDVYECDFSDHRA